MTWCTDACLRGLGSGVFAVHASGEIGGGEHVYTLAVSMHALHGSVFLAACHAR